MKCQMCQEKEAKYKVSLPNYKGNIAQYRCEECCEQAKQSFSDIEIEEI